MHWRKVQRFTFPLARKKRKGLPDYALLAQRYVESFEQKWVLRNPAPSEELLRAADIQSRTDLGNSNALACDIRSIPFGLEDITRLAAATADRLLLTIFLSEELIMRIVKTVFSEATARHLCSYDYTNNLGQRLRSALPALHWALQYQQQWLRLDFVAGLTLAAYAIPVSLPNASLAELPGEAGLYC